MRQTEFLLCGHPRACDGMAGPDGDQHGCGWCADIADNKTLIDHLSRTYAHFSGGRISKPMTLPEEVFREAEDIQDEGWREYLQEYLEDAREKARLETGADDTP